MIREIFTKQFNYNYEVLKINTEKLNDEDGLIQPQKGGNCLNWVIGHIIATRGTILKSLNEQSVWDKKTTALYERGSAPITGTRNSKALSLKKLLDDFELSQKRLIAGLNRLNKDDKELVEKIAMFSFHESYHVGQTGLLRRIIGKEGAIK
ncbi:MAG: DinB family protein [Cytophagales bacterium]|nr:DinB family protein [Cytophagales bacterium]